MCDPRRSSPWAYIVHTVCSFTLNFALMCSVMSRIFLLVAMLLGGLIFFQSVRQSYQHICALSTSE
ncbi:hypothetical protein F5Y10DRAFT_244634 [Nemania abortiva]|nr:hypothetical protein F5Y10DRAFT_244634 [Nemania abortiva]